VVRTSADQVKNFKPRQGVGSNVTFDDLSDVGFNASPKAFTEGREKSESQKDFTEGNKGNKAAI
jgi:hypothetical protein